MSLIEVDYIGEGRSDDLIAKRMILAVKGTPGTPYRRPLGGTGKSSLDGRLEGLNKGTVFRNPVLVLRDLDTDAACAPALLQMLLPNRNVGMLLRVCVAQSESWLMADRHAYARFCGIPVNKIPDNPESLANPKRLIQAFGESGNAIHLHRHFQNMSRKGIPMWGMLGEWHAHFAENHWNPVRAAESNRAPSLTRAMVRLREIVKNQSRRGV